MSKYIDADKLIEAIEEIKKAEYENCGGVNAKTGVLQEVQELITSFQQEQSETPSGEEVMTMCNQILIDWVKEGKTPEEREQREQAHIRFFELYDEYMERPDVDLEKEIESYLDGFIKTPTRTYFRDTIRHFYGLGLKARKV